MSAPVPPSLPFRGRLRRRAPERAARPPAAAGADAEPPRLPSPEGMALRRRIRARADGVCSARARSAGRGSASGPSGIGASGGCTSAPAWARAPSRWRPATSACAITGSRSSCSCPRRPGSRPSAAAARATRGRASRAGSRRTGRSRSAALAAAARRARAVVDDTAAYYERHTSWRWSAGVGLSDDRRAVAWNLVARRQRPAC